MSNAMFGKCLHKILLLVDLIFKFHWASCIYLPIKEVKTNPN